VIPSKNRTTATASGCLAMPSSSSSS
jgi:hypothetical protein